MNFNFNVSAIDQPFYRQILFLLAPRNVQSGRRRIQYVGEKGVLCLNGPLLFNNKKKKKKEETFNV